MPPASLTRCTAVRGLTRRVLRRVIFTLTAVAGPAFADKFHFECVQTWTLGYMGATMLLVGLVPQRALLGIFVLAALSQGLKGIFDAALQGLVGSAAPPDKRGKYTGLVELAWGFSSLIGLPVSGALLAAEPRAMFLFLGAVQILPALLMSFSTPLAPWAAPAIAAEADAAPAGDAETVLPWRRVLTHAGVVQRSRVQHLRRRAFGRHGHHRLRHLAAGGTRAGHQPRGSCHAGARLCGPGRRGVGDGRHRQDRDPQSAARVAPLHRRRSRCAGGVGGRRGARRPHRRPDLPFPHVHCS